MKSSGNITISSVFSERSAPAVMSKKIDSVAAGPLHSVYLSPRAFSAAVTCLRPHLCLTLPFFSSLLAFRCVSRSPSPSPQTCPTDVSTGWTPSCTCCPVWTWMGTTAGCCYPPSITWGTRSPSLSLRYGSVNANTRLHVREYQIAATDPHPWRKMLDFRFIVSGFIVWVQACVSRWVSFYWSNDNLLVLSNHLLNANS